MRRLLLSLPGVEEGPCYGTPGYRVRGKLIARIREDGATLVVRCSRDERDVLMQIEPETFFVTDHYRAHSWVLVRLNVIGLEELRELLQRTWRGSATKTLIAAHEAGSRPGKSAGRGGASRPAG